MEQALREHAATLTRLADRLADATAWPGREPSDVEFSYVVGEATQTALEILTTVGDHDAAEALETALAS